VNYPSRTQVVNRKWKFAGPNMPHEFTNVSYDPYDTLTVIECQVRIISKYPTNGGSFVMFKKDLL